MTKTLFMALTGILMTFGGLAQANTMGVEKMTATCYFKNATNKTLELSAFSPPENDEIDQATAKIYLTDPESGKKLQLLASYSLKSDAPKDRLSMIFKFSNSVEKVSLEIVEADDNTGISTLAVNGKRSKLNCDIE
jgi:hypothetical protein